jgi:mono/diheme cytochrome c family protein
MSDSEHTPSTSNKAPLYGVMAEYDTPTALVLASRKVRDAGYRRWDTYTPFPIHGIEKAMGIQMTKLPWFVLGMALLGLASATVFQYWTNSVDYKWLISGKPFWSWPANVPIIFEGTILFSAFATIGGMLFLNNLPLPAHPLDLKERFGRASDDKFFLVIEASDPKFDEKDTRKLLESTSPAVLDDVLEDRVTSDQIPKGLMYALVIAGAASLVPFAMFAQARVSKSEKGRFHLVWDMDFTPSYKAQSDNNLFDDQRAMRKPPQGTVAVGQLKNDDHLYRGQIKGAWAATLPKKMVADETTMALGRQQFGIYCAPCHGLSGDGNGMVHQRASTLKQGWVPPSNLHQKYIKEQPAGQLFATITNGIRNMPGYASQIDPEERWAIVLYLRALQKSQGASVGELTDAERAQLK